ncbi:MAG: hypothetical protein ABJQ34_00975 [Paracoccaceae bacterium]|uniref:hypothetical protein n=1 Tax=Pseudophaeobacter sp. TaxID=1971739 RepID=UPI0032970F78
MSDSDETPASDQTVNAFEADKRGVEWIKTPPHIPAKRPVKVYSIERSDLTLRIATSPPPLKNTLN